MSKENVSTTETTTYMVTKVTPPVAVVAGNIAGLSLPELVQWATLLYLALMISHKVWRMYKEWKSGKGALDESGE